MTTPDPTTGTREEYKALLLRAYDDHVALEKKYLDYVARYRDWKENVELRAQRQALKRLIIPPQSDAR